MRHTIKSMKRPKAAVVVPSICDFYTTPQRLAALGEKIVATILQNAGWDTRWLHFPKAGKRTLQLPPVLSHLKPYLMPGEFGPTAFFSKYHRFGPSPHAAAGTILAGRPEAVFLSCFAFAYADDTLALARHLKDQCPSLPVFAGGAGVSVLPEYFLVDGSIDAVIPGEAEHALLAFLEGTPWPAVMSWRRFLWTCF